MEYNQKMDMSIIIPNLHSLIVDQTIRSILNQKSHYSFEIIIVGQDKYNKICDFIQEKVQFIETDKPTPPGIARNIGVQNSKGSFIFFIDSDCVASPHWIDSHMELHGQHQKPIVVGGGVAFSKKSFLELTDNISTFHEYMLHIKTSEKTQLPTLNMSLSKALWDTTNGFNQDLVGEDAEFTTKLHLRRVKLLFSAKPYITHKPNRNNLIHLFVRAYNFGKFSIKGKKEFKKKLGVPYLLQNKIFTLLFSPFISGFLVIKMVFFEKLPLGYWHTIPLIFILKIIWCFGYFSNLIRPIKEN